MIKSNFHTHSTFCDGCDSVEDIVKVAIKKGFNYLGFSSHSYIEGDDTWTLKKHDFKSYVKEVLRVKEKYKADIKIFCGIEQDSISKQYPFKFDYIIGSMHSIEKDGKVYSLDYNVGTFKNLLENVYSNDFNALCKDYYQQIKQVAIKTNANIIGHFDLITKFVQELNLSLPKNYLNYAKEAVSHLLKRTKIFEINTGAMVRGYRATPYPQKEILKFIFENGGQIMINSDCHQKDFLDYGFSEAESLAKSVGFTTHVVVTNEGLKLVEI